MAIEENVRVFVLNIVSYILIHSCVHMQMHTVFVYVYDIIYIVVIVE